MSNVDRVLITGGTGAFGSATARYLARAGHDVVVMARNEPASLPRGVTFVKGDIAVAEDVRRAMEGCDAVAHLAWVLSGAVTFEQAAPINIGGTQNVLDAMQDTGCSRLVFASSITAYGAHKGHPQPWVETEPLEPAHGLVYEHHKAEAEKMIAASGVSALSVRPTVVVGRHTFNGPANVYRQDMIPTLGGARLQAIHNDDVGRFFAHAIDHHATGAVNLAPADVVTWADVAELVGRRKLPLAPGPVKALTRAIRFIPVARSAPELFDLFLYFPIGDTTRLNTDLGFTPAYSSREALLDQGLTARGYHTIGMKRWRHLRQLDRIDTPPPIEPLDDDARHPGTHGEFDTTDLPPEYPEWTCANLEEAFPGPMTPLSLELTSNIMFSSAQLVAQMLPLDDRIAEAVSKHQIGIFGHRIYQNVSVLRDMVTAVPGQTPEDFENQINGVPYPEGYTPPRTSLKDVGGYARFAAVAGPRLAGIKREIDVVVQRAEQVARESAELSTMDDARLLSRIDNLWDDVVRAWQVGNVCTFLVSSPTGQLERSYGRDAVTAVNQSVVDLPSARLGRGVQQLAAVAAADDQVRQALAGTITMDTWKSLRSSCPEFADRVDALIASCGHRGPGETELANATYGDRPDLLLRAIAGSMDVTRAEQTVQAPTGRKAQLLMKAAAGAIERRERCRDAVTLTTHQLRRAVRELGQRLTAAGQLASPDDVFYLTREELPRAFSHDFTAAVQRRRQERERLQTMTFPLRFTGAPEPVEAGSADTDAPTAITGAGVSPGVARGRVRILRTPDDELEPDEVLVARATDTGWTPFFAVAAAVVTDIGGLMSHASIVARDFGVPAVVGTDGASTQLRDGQLVEVDGTAGTVTVIAE